MKISRSQLISLKLSSPQHAQSDEHCNPYLKMLLCLEEKGRMRSLRAPWALTITVTSTVILCQFDVSF